MPDDPGMEIQNPVSLKIHGILRTGRVYLFISVLPLLLTVRYKKSYIFKQNGVIGSETQALSVVLMLRHPRSYQEQ